MSKTMAVYVVLVAAAAIVPARSQSTDPKANDQTGNGPPAVVITKGDGTQNPTKDEKKRAAAERPLSGFVTDADGKPVVGAIVQLKNTRTLQVRSFITRDKGDYYFAGLSKDVDYEVKATLTGHASAIRTLSSFDPKPQPVLNLQIK
jgi:hypothetical protein